MPGLGSSFDSLFSIFVVGTDAADQTTRVAWSIFKAWKQNQDCGT
jgi:hypothetical protein